MNKLIIENRACLSDIDALEIIKMVVNAGRCSNNGKQYSYGALITFNGGKYFVSTYLNKRSDRFVITNR